jgi:uncharacterized protein YfbU (UPF0304 family)
MVAGPTKQEGARPMTLTEFERMSLINQLSIRKALEKGNTRDIDELIEILREGYEVFYDEVSQYHGLDEPMPAELSKFVLDVLMLYRAIEFYKTEHPEDAEIQKMDHSHFAGFDGNNDGACLGFTRFLIETQGKFDEQRPHKERTDGFNSHWPVRETYERMLAKWNALGRPIPLEREQVVQILQAAST